MPRLSIILLAAVSPLISGCASERLLMPTPVMYTGEDPARVFENTPMERLTPPVDLLYMTNREANTDPEVSLPYGYGRSKHVAFGSVQVDLGPDLSWETIAEASTRAERDPGVQLALGETTELGRYPRSPYRVKMTPSGLVRHPDALRDHALAEITLNAEVQRRLELAPTREVVLYIHGFNETFESAAFTLAELCHFLGREHLCALYTWPAGSGGGLLFAYGRDRESGEYSVGHVKRMIRLLSMAEGVEKVHILAHSRGTDITLQAVRELMIEAYAAGKVPKQTYKIANLILLAPDIDSEVANQRLSVFSSDPSMPSPFQGHPMPAGLSGKLTVYASPSDRALAASTWLFGSKGRLGRLRPQDLTEDDKARWREHGVIQLIEAPRRRVDLLGHGYFTTDPAVSADLVAMIRYGLQPGEDGRPLRPIEPPLIWGIIGADLGAAD